MGETVLDREYEAERLQRLLDLRLLDTPAEPLFDALTRAAAELTGSPVALVTLIEQDRQWFKSNYGLPGAESTTRSTAMCDYAIRSDELMEVRDARRDVRFSRFETVVGEPHVRFYAGAPLTLSSGYRIGTLCVFDTVPRDLTDSQRTALQQLAKATVAAIELRAQLMKNQESLTRNALELSSQLQRGAALERRLRASEAFLERTGKAAGVGGFEADLDGGDILWSDETCRIHEVPPGFIPSTYEEAYSFYPEPARGVIQQAVQHAVETSEGWDLELPLVTRTGRPIWVRTMGNMEVLEGRRKLVGAFQDVTLRHRAVEAMEASERRFRKIFQFSLGLICTHDADGMVLSINPAAARSLGMEVSALLGRPLSTFMRAERHEQFQAYLARIYGDGIASGTIELIASDGGLRYWNFHNVLDDEGDEPYVLAHAQDVTAQYGQERLLRELSQRDPLTNCFNRRYLLQLETLWAQAPVACVAFDLDHFKQVNDTHGHQRGDEVLVGFAEFLQRHTRDRDVVVRLGGDEFAVLLAGASEEGLQQWLSRVRADADQAPIGFSKGAAVRIPGETLEQTLANADQELYRKRRRHRSRVAGD
ncbi:PAS domain S-box-containing protein/diguanylate cyclase (GGDEF) domain-containing protein [Pseudoxanthomonas sp. GM95]|uniref:sensor domain-containing diguanylate cyclase n=1 Tax=Pseudoxanthomonas sp. GM95 TaxID=1881043 RepID=UPI0008BB73E4|nr:diguanylate cyclase [Pseudoxanthomonas sp. GM95]SEL45821.1 PAS domain S-box-containing protein/diguanylate cyclase (GGDEF) domain-containing protein [Pseudoxanthomonas sp. GM95]